MPTATRAGCALDCCYAGRADLDQMAPVAESIAQVVANQAMIEGACVLTATDAFHRAYAPPGAQYTAFTGALIETLTAGISDAAALLDLTTLHVHLRDVLRSRSHPDPKLRNRDTAGWVALARNRARPAASSSPEVVARPPPATVRSVRDVGAVIEKALDRNVRRLHGGAVAGERVAAVNHQLRQLTATIGVVLRELARTATVDDVAAAAAAHLGDLSVSRTLRTVNQVQMLRDLALTVTAHGDGDGSAMPWSRRPS